MLVMHSSGHSNQITFVLGSCRLSSPERNRKILIEGISGILQRVRPKGMVRFGHVPKESLGKDRLPSGIKFMPHTGMKRLARTLKEDFKTGCKLMACKMKGGATPPNTMRFPGPANSAVRDWLVLMHRR